MSPTGRRAYPGFRGLGGAPRPRDERGDTLIEVLIALVIIGLMADPLLGSLGTTLTSAAEHRSLATIDTLLKSFAETAKSAIELAPPSSRPYSACATTYNLLSTPTPTSGPVGAAVTVFGTGFLANTPFSSFSVTIGPLAIPATTIASQSQPSADSVGNMQVTFFVPPGLPTGSAEAITLSDGNGDTSSSIPGSGFTVNTTTPVVTTSPVARYTMGITSIQSWDSEAAAFDNTCVKTADWGLQQINLQANAPNSSDTLSFVVRNPNYDAPPTPTPAVTVVGSPPLATPGTPLIFTTTVTPSAGYPTPTGSISWTISLTPSGSAPTCSSKTPLTQGTGNSATATCTVTSTSAVGTYTAQASYSGNAYNRPASGSGSQTVERTPTLSMPNPSNSTTLVFTLTVTGANNVTPTGTVTWTISVNSGVAPTCPDSTLSGSGNSATATCTINPAAVGTTYTVNPTYDGDANYYGGTATAAGQG